MKNNTNYMRSVNDYSLSAHEIFNEVTGNRFPADTRVMTANNITAQNFIDASEISLGIFFKDGYTLDKTYTINYDDGSDPGDESQYTIYEQAFHILKRPGTAGDHATEAVEDNVIVLEVYRRNGQLIILTLSPTSTLKYLTEAALLLREKYKAPKKDKTFYTISQSSHGFELEEMKIPTVYDDTSFTLLYNDEFLPVHETIIDFIDNEKKGLILLHGIPGSGKTSYIKQLISKGGTRKLVYIPPHLASSIASPQFITFVRDKLKSCVLVIEDAEEILQHRDTNHNSTAVSNLLNISDGILGEALNILIIATFNVDKREIDPALMRKGRMVAEYHFGELDKDKALALTHKLYGETATLPDGERTLANIFNAEVIQHRTPEPKKAAFGFQAK